MKVTQIKSPVVQQQDYYPFGLTFNDAQRENTSTNQYKYNRKESQDELNLGWLDFGARMYMAEIGRWGTLDPLAEKSRRWNPYAYAMDNPIRFIDPDGMSAMPGMEAMEANVLQGEVATNDNKEEEEEEEGSENKDEEKEKKKEDPGKGNSYNRSGAPGLLLGWARLLGVDADSDFFYGFVNPEASDTPSNEPSGLGEAANGAGAGAGIAEKITEVTGDKKAADLLGKFGKFANGVSIAADVGKAVTSGRSSTAGDWTKIAIEGVLAVSTKVAAPVAALDQAVGLISGTSIAGRIGAGIDYSRKKK